MLKSSTQFITQ